MKLKDIRIRRVITKKRKRFLWIKYTETIFISNILEAKYDGDWVKLNTFIDEKFI